MTDQLKLRSFKPQDLEQVITIWLNNNKTAHDFIAPSFWEDNLSNVKEALPQSDLTVCCKVDQIVGFIGIVDNQYIAGIFVSSNNQSNGIGKRLLDHAKSKYQELTLSCFVKNIRAIQFYKNNGFSIDAETLNPDTNEKNYAMQWKAS